MNIKKNKNDLISFALRPSFNTSRLKGSDNLIVKANKKANTVAKLNLAFAIARSPGGYSEAIQINRDIIAYDPDEPKVYNNIATYLKMDFNKNFEECERLYLKAIELNTDYVEPYIGYANLLKLVKRTEEGNKRYRKARIKDKTKYYKPVIDAALKSEKG